MKHNWTAAEAWSRGSAALFASSALYVAFSVACVTALPVSAGAGIAIGILAGFPLWVAAAMYAVLARTPTRAWLVLAGVTVFLSGCAVLGQTTL
jgi:hypothetical protein